MNTKKELVGIEVRDGKHGPHFYARVKVDGVWTRRRLRGVADMEKAKEAAAEIRTLSGSSVEMLDELTRKKTANEITIEQALRLYQEVRARLREGKRVLIENSYSNGNGETEVLKLSD